MTKFSDVPAAGITIRESANDGSDFTTNTPADYRRLFLGEDGKLHLKDSAGTVTDTAGAETLPVSIIAAKGDLIVGTNNDTAAVLTAGANDFVLTAADGEATGLKWAAAAAAAASDPISEVFGTPTAAYEFSTSSSGLTSLSTTPDVMDSDTTVPGALFINDNDAGLTLVGAFAAIAVPFTAIACVIGDTVRANYNYAGLFVGVNPPGKYRLIAHKNAARTVAVIGANDPTGTSAADVAAGSTVDDDVFPPVYYAIVVNSSTDINFAYSRGGYVWRQMVDAHNPSATIGCAGVGVASYAAGGVSAAFGFLRIWDSALTLPGY